MKHIFARRLTIASGLIALSALSFTTAAYAQYVWLDEQGSKQYSDIPPPPSVPQSRILKSPRGVVMAPAAATEATSASAAAAAPSAKAPMTTAEKNVDFNKRRAEQIEKEKKAADDAKLAADKAKNCDKAREYKAALDSGERIDKFDKNGDRVPLTDEQRAQETKDSKRVLGDCKS
ncbi:MAG: DUF4124 domain-containing protein [Pseudomonadota bacterium]